MAFHIPFEHRRRNRHNIGPVYIGFDVPAPRPRRKFNWWGFNGLWMSLLAFASAGFLSPIPLGISLIGLRREGKKMALAGTVFSLMGVALASSIVFMGISQQHHRQYVAQQRQMQRVLGEQVETTELLMADATDELEEYRDAHNGVLPTWINCNMLLTKYEDPWGTSLRFDVNASDWGTLRSAGPDTEFRTDDDLTIKIEGQTDRQSLIEVE